MKKLLSKKFKESEGKINKKFAGKKANITKEYNQKIKELLIKSGGLTNGR
ncbi:hypothetical protein ES705_31249 [subsurface metagenome]